MASHRKPTKSKSTSSGYVEYHRKRNAGLRISDENIQRLALLADHYSIGKADVVEMLIRDRCRQEGIDL